MYEREWELYRKNKNKILEIRKKKKPEIVFSSLYLLLFWFEKRKGKVMGVMK